MKIVAIDPGTTNTGLVWMDEHEILDARKLGFSAHVMNDNRALAERCRAVTDALDEYLWKHPHERVVMEGYQRYPGIKAAASTLHQTPWLCGAICERLISLGEPYEIQLSGEVLNPRRSGNLAQQRIYLQDKSNMVHVYRGQELLKNEHTRTAFLHGYYYLRRIGLAR